MSARGGAADYGADEFRRALDEGIACARMEEGVKAIVELTHYSRGHLCRKMKAELGLSPSAYLREKRLYAARDYALYSDMPIEEIAERVGYSSVSHFVQLFRCRFGETPSAMRRQRRAAEP